MPGGVSILIVVGSTCFGDVLLLSEFTYISLFSVKYMKFLTYTSECCLANVYYRVNDLFYLIFVQE